MTKTQETSHAPRRGIDEVAIAAFVLALLVWPVGLVVSRVALRRIRRSGDAGHGLATAAWWIAVTLAVISGLIWMVNVGVFDRDPDAYSRGAEASASASADRDAAMEASAGASREAERVLADQADTEMCEVLFSSDPQGIVATTGFTDPGFDPRTLSPETRDRAFAETDKAKELSRTTDTQWPLDNLKSVFDNEAYPDDPMLYEVDEDLPEHISYLVGLCDGLGVTVETTPSVASP
ncbi:DUF4190 domain-containing protein [Pengzhenrongella frigida]|uniref:DUF4190 domain-containing protein n=1 Tax=Pengzhenrongella frigida TaxID=1259133 RepID=A0A4Q5N1J5_9MICO|nr:DUF4190 domain-containing protein [Cellulomonas sp. HLT2-17]RYV51143.1 DUF4190 domain-containing protein [Cellulomonas sp. HLT2-17]